MLELKVKVIEAKNLAAKDRNGLSDPFVVIKIGDMTVKTDVKFKTLNPNWNQEFTFRIAPDMIYANMTLNIFDKDFIGKDFLGVVTIPILEILKEHRSFEEASKEPREYKLQGQNVSGSIFLVSGFLNLPSHLKQESFEYNFDDLKDSIEDLYFQQFMTNEKNQEIDSGQDVMGLLRIDIQSAQNLPHVPNLIRATFDSDPFVIISFGSKVFKTKKVRHSLNPIWNERLYLQIHQSEVESNHAISFNVYDHDIVSNHDFIGQVLVKIQSILDQCPAPSKVENVPSSMVSVPFSLPLSLKTQKEATESIFNFSCSFLSYKELRRNFWIALAKGFDSTNTQKLNKIELITLLDTIGCTFSHEMIDKIFHPLQEWTYEQVFESIEYLLFHQDLMDKEHLLQMKHCPICKKKIHLKQDLNIVSHVALCSFQDFSKMDQFVMNGFLTESYTSRKWYTKIISYVTQGSYGIGKNNANILVKNRETGQLFEERIPSYIRLGIRLLYQKTSSTALDSQTIKKLLSSLTMKQGKKFNDPSSVKHIPAFIKYHQLNLSEILQDLDHFSSFNEFFYRKLKPTARVLASLDEKIATCPSDCRLLVFPTLTRATDLWIKGRNFNLTNLLQDEQMANQFEGGSVVICRLAPQDYHRFHIPVNGTLSQPKFIKGEYYTVNPMAIRTTVDVYTENLRAVSFIDSPEFGKVGYVCIGAMMVGSIHLTSTPDSQVKRLEEHGYFAFGGSTCLLLFQKDSILFDKDLVENSLQCLETLVKVGQSLGVSQLVD